ncbi:hypothetical protein ACFLX7_00135 [Chloroflexota bacterium]
MPFAVGQPLFLISLADAIMEPFIKKPLFGESFITLGDMLHCMILNYENGAILARKFSDRLTVFEQLLGSTKDGEVIEQCQNSAKERLDEICDFRVKKEEGLRETLNIFEKTATPARIIELSNAIESRRQLEFPDKQPASFHIVAEFVLNKDDYEIPPDYYIEDRKECLDKKLPYLALATTHIYLSGVEGIGFGILSPELTERMLKFSISSLEERGQQVMRFLSDYVRKYYPELLEPLGLLKR